MQANRAIRAIQAIQAIRAIRAIRAIQANRVAGLLIQARPGIAYCCPGGPGQA